MGDLAWIVPTLFILWGIHAFFASLFTGYWSCNIMSQNVYFLQKVRKSFCFCIFLFFRKSLMMFITLVSKCSTISISRDEWSINVGHVTNWTTELAEKNHISTFFSFSFPILSQYPWMNESKFIYNVNKCSPYLDQKPYNSIDIYQCFQQKSPRFKSPYPN